MNSKNIWSFRQSYLYKNHVQLVQIHFLSLHYICIWWCFDDQTHNVLLYSWKQNIWISEEGSKQFSALLTCEAYVGTASSYCDTSSPEYIHCCFQWTLLKYLNMLTWNIDEISTSARYYQVYVVLPITTNGLISCCRYTFSKSRNCAHEIKSLLPSSWLFFNPEDGGITSPHNVQQLLPDYIVSHRRKKNTVKFCYYVGVAGRNEDPGYWQHPVFQKSFARDNFLMWQFLFTTKIPNYNKKFYHIQV